MKPVDFDTTLLRGGRHDLFSVECIRMADYGLPEPDFATIFFAEILHESNTSTVYGGYLLDQYENRAHDVVIKLGDQGKIEYESQNYILLASLQGRVIPVMFGYWLADREEGKCPWGCLVLERFGAQVDASFWHMEVYEKSILLNHLRDIHNQGLLHTDFHPRNVLQKDKEFRVIDLKSLVDHSCTECVLDFMMIPTDKHGGRKLCDLCHSMRVVVDDIAFCGFDEVWLGSFHLISNPNFPSKKMMLALFPQCLRSQYECNAGSEEFLSQYYQRLYQKMKELDLEDARESVDRLSQEAPQIFTDLKMEFSSRLKLLPSYGSCMMTSALGYASVWPVPEDVEVC